MAEAVREEEEVIEQMEPMEPIDPMEDTIEVVDVDEEPFETDENEDLGSAEALKYVAGYICGKFRHKYPDLVSNEDNNECAWIDLKDRGALLRPSRELIKSIQTYEQIFLDVHGEDILREEDPMKKVGCIFIYLLSLHFDRLTPKSRGGGGIHPPMIFFYLQPKRFEIELCNFLTFPDT